MGIKFKETEYEYTRLKKIVVLDGRQQLFWIFIEPETNSDRVRIAHVRNFTGKYTHLNFNHIYNYMTENYYLHQDCTDYHEMDEQLRKGNTYYCKPMMKRTKDEIEQDFKEYRRMLKRNEKRLEKY